jgi:hypothetical protein
MKRASILSLAAVAIALGACASSPYTDRSSFDSRGSTDTAPAGTISGSFTGSPGMAETPAVRSAK